MNITYALFIGTMQLHGVHNNKIRSESTEQNGSLVVLKNRKHKKINKKRGQMPKGNANEAKICKYLSNGDIAEAYQKSGLILRSNTSEQLKANRIVWLEAFIKTSEHKATVIKCKKELKLLKKG